MYNYIYGNTSVCIASYHQGISLFLVLSHVSLLPSPRTQQHHFTSVSTVLPNQQI